MKYLAIIIVLLLVANNIQAQNIINDGSVKNRVYTRVGIEPTTMFAIGYQHNFQIGDLKNQLTSYGEWSTSLFRFGFKNSELKIGGIIPVFERGSFKIVNDLNLSAGTTNNINFESNKFAAADEVAFGWYKPKWFVAATAEYEWIYLNQITHTDQYRERYYPDAVDGWYKGGGGKIQFGIEGGYTIKQMIDIHLEVKIPFTEKFNNYAGAPLHVNLGVGYRF